MPSHFDELPETQPQFDFDDDESDVENVPNGDLLQKPVAFLIFDENGSEERRQPIYGSETIIGRDPQQCQIAITHNTSISTVSRVHAKISFEKGTHFIETLSTNSNTKLNKAQLMHGRIYAIADGTMLTFGTVQARYVMQSNNQELQESSDDVVRNVGDQLNMTIDPDGRENEELPDSLSNQTIPFDGNESRNAKSDELVTSPTTALTTSVVKETPLSVDKDGSGLQLRLEESSPEPEGSPEKMDTSGVRAQLNFSVGAADSSQRDNPLSETQDFFQQDTSAVVDTPSATPPPFKSQPSQSSPEIKMPPLRRLVNITPIRAVVSPAPVAVDSEPSLLTMDVDLVYGPNTQQLAETQAYLLGDPTAQLTPTAAVDGDDREVPAAAQMAATDCEWTTNTELAALIKGHKELNTVPDILKSYTPRKKPDQEYDFDEDNPVRSGEKSEEKDRPVVTPVVTRAHRAKVDKKSVGVVAEERAKLTPPRSALQKHRFEYFDPKSNSGKRRSGRTPRMPAVVAKKTPKVETKTPASAAPSTGRNRKVIKQESAETIASETTTPLRRSTRKVKRIHYASPPSTEDSEPDSDDRPLIELVPKRTSNFSRGSSLAKRVKVEIDNEKPKTKKMSVKVAKEATPSVESSPDDTPLIVYRRNSSEVGNKSAQKKQKRPLTTPKHSALEESTVPPVEQNRTPVRRGAKMKVVLKTVKEDAPSSPLHTPVDRRRIRKPETKFEEFADESIALVPDEAVSSATPPVSAALDMSSDDPSKLTPTSSKPPRNRSQTTPMSVARTNSLRQTSGTRASTRIKFGSDGVGILLSSACMQDEELLQIAEEFGEAKSICEATHFVANQARRTSKLVASVARGIPVVTSEWLHACKRKGKLIETNEFILEGDIAGCDLRNAIEKSRNGWLSLDGWFIARTENAEPSAEEMSGVAEVVKAAGGTLVDSLTEECSLLVAHVNDRDDPLVRDAIKRHVPIVQGRMLYQAILEHRTDFKNPRLALKFL